MPCTMYTDETLQNSYWEGFTQADEVENRLLFNFYGELVHAGINYPDVSTTVRGLYFDRKRLSEVRCKLVCERNENELSDISASAALADVDALVKKSMPSKRQSSE
eukprot:IDg9222t1